MNDRTNPVERGLHPRHSTLLALVQGLTRQGRSEREVEIAVLELVEDGRVVLTGNFRDTPLCPTRSGLRGAGWEAPSDVQRTQTLR